MYQQIIITINISFSVLFSIFHKNSPGLYSRLRLGEDSDYIHYMYKYLFLLFLDDFKKIILILIFKGD